MNKSNPKEFKRAPTGIDGLDAMTCGGIAKDRSTLVIGGPGTGKTVLGLQLVVTRSQHFDEPGMFIAFEERTGNLAANIQGFDWMPDSLDDQKLLLFDARLGPDTLQAGEFDLNGLLSQLSVQAEAIQAQWVVFDSVDFLLANLNDRARERQELYRLVDWAENHGLTAILTGKLDEENEEIQQRYSFLQFLVDCVIQLEHEVEDRISTRKVRIVKYRGSAFVENELPLTIGPSGIEIPNVTESATAFPASTERISTGVARLDSMLNGGIYRGSSLLYSGAPGTSKTSLAGAFLDAACQRGERCLYISFDESPEEIIRNLRSIGIDLRPHIESGLLQMRMIRSDTASAEAHLMSIQSLVRNHSPQCIALDPASALIKAGGTDLSRHVMERLLHQVKASGATLVMTSLIDTDTTTEENTPLEVSTLADTWIQLSYKVQAGERNRALTVIKSRGVKHSNQVRELQLDHTGITLADVYTAEGQVLFGTLRWQKENEERLRNERDEIETKRKRRELELAQAELKAREEALKRELEMKQAELEELVNLDSHRKQEWQRHREELRHKRGGDKGQDSST